MSARLLKILVVDDDRFQRQILSKGLEPYTVVTAASGEEARTRIATNGYDVIIADLIMPGGISGLDLLREIRHKDPDMPVIIVTAKPADEADEEAISLATRYLLKPVPNRILMAEIRRAARLHDLARVLRQAVGAGPSRADRRADLMRAMSGLWMLYQPIVDVADRSVYAYEALLRTPTMTPDVLIDLAHELGELEDVGRRVRAAVAADMATADSEISIFVNLHPSELLDEELMSAEAPLSVYAARVTLEITERASIERVPDLGRRIAKLRELGYRLAVDDLGVGHSGLSSMNLLDPEVAKLDASLVRGIDRRPVQQRRVKAVVKMLVDTAALVVAEAIETPEERDALLAAGVTLQQGYLFSRPGKPFPVVAW